MSAPGTTIWFARHELRLAWRDMLSMMTAGRRNRERKIAVGAVIFFAILHGIAFLSLRHAGGMPLRNSLPTLIAVTAGIVLSASAILSQAMETVTRTFYSRSDLELILSSPAHTHRLFAVRIGAIALSSSLMSLFLFGPFIDVLAWRGGLRWLGAYGVIVAVSFVVTALGVALTALLFRTIGPKRTRLAAQIAAAAIGGAFVIGLQIAAMFSTGTMSRIAYLQSRSVIAMVPGIDSIVWWPARAALGDVAAFAAVFTISAALLFTAIVFFAPRFADYVLAATGVPQGGKTNSHATREFCVRNAPTSLRRKEIALLLRDPWLVSQSLMQLLYLIPPALLLWRSFTFQGHAAILLVPVLIMASGQLAGGLAWLTISGEDAPDLVQTAPVPQSRIWRAKIEAVLECVGLLFAPFLVGLLFVSPSLALIACAGIAASAGAAATIHFWFRSQAKRANFRRRHTSSRIATFSEAFSSITWAATGAIAAAGSWLAAFVGLIAIGILAGVRFLSPSRGAEKFA